MHHWFTLGIDSSLEIAEKAAAANATSIRVGRDVQAMPEPEPEPEPEPVLLGRQALSASAANAPFDSYDAMSYDVVAYDAGSDDGPVGGGG